MQVEHIPLEQLKTWPGHARKGEAKVDDLVASIAAEGLLQPLIVTKNASGYYVIAGNRRLQALSWIAESQGAAMDVPCHVLPPNTDDDKLLEISLAENAMRLDMHPMDEAEAFAKLAGEGKDLPGIARAFNVSERFVKQRLVLTALPEKVRTMYRKGEMTYADAVALTKVTDKKLLASVLKRGKEWNGNYEGAVRSAQRTEPRFHVEHARFATEPNYKTAEDLFDQHDDGKPVGPYFVDYKAAMCEQRTWLVGHMADEQRSGAYAFVSAIEHGGFYQEYRTAEDKEKKGVGLVLWIEPSGMIKEQRVVSLKSERQQEKAKVKQEVARKAERGETVHAGDISHVFKCDLEELHRAALIEYMAANPDVLAEHLNVLVSFRRHESKIHDDTRAAMKRALTHVIDLGTLTSKVAIQIGYNQHVLKKVGKELTLGVIDWPKSMLKRLPRKLLEAEAKAIGVTTKGEVTKEQLVERTWKAKPEGWVPLYAKVASS